MFQPVIPIGGLGGWRFLQQTYDSQFKAFTQSAQLQRDTEYFREKIGGIETAEQLVSDRRLLTVALGAFGLQDDINNRFFIQKMLQEGSVNEDALANRFTDSRYKNMVEAFGFGPGEERGVVDPAFADRIINRFEKIEFEVAAGRQNEAMRFALYAEREMSSIAGEDMSNDAKWFTLMGEPPLRSLFEKAFNLPSSFGQIDLDQQLSVFKARARKEFGTDDLSIFSDPAQVQELITKYIVREQLSQFNAGFSSNAIALTLLRGGG